MKKVKTPLQQKKTLLRKRGESSKKKAGIKRKRRK